MASRAHHSVSRAQEAGGGSPSRAGAPGLAALVSPATRTRATFEHLVANWPRTPAATYEKRLYDARPEAILAVIRAAGTSTPTLLVIGHNPGLHEIARLLIAAGDIEPRERLNEALPTSGLVVIDFAGKDWREVHPQGGRLERFVSPRWLAAATD